MKLEIEIEEGDVLYMNDKYWEVVNEPRGERIDMNPEVGEARCFDRDYLEELLAYSGKVELIKEDYRSIF